MLPPVKKLKKRKIDFNCNTKLNQSFQQVRPVLKMNCSFRIMSV